MFASIKPNWFASVMGTGIVANAAVLLPFTSSVLTAIAISFWLLAATLLIVLTVVGIGHFILHRDLAGSHYHSLGMAPFYGAVAMAFLTVGSGTLLAGTHVIGEQAAVWADATLWTLGTVSGLACAVAIPYKLFTEFQPRLEDAYGSWLMPVVPPMVSAAAGAGLVPHLVSGQPRLDLLLGCYAMFGVSLMMALIVITILWARLALHGVGEARMAPTFWIVLGPLGQSITAVCLLAHVAPDAVNASTAAALHNFALLYGVVIWGFALAWLTIALMITIRTARDHLPFAPTWWSFTFPLGTVVTGTSQLAVTGDLHALRYVALGLYVGLVCAWATVAGRTLVTSLRQPATTPPFADSHLSPDRAG
jgi:C4-dicarboxylate transporter/malic acid transport protein